MHTLSQWIASFRTKNLLVQYDIYSATADEIKDRIEKGVLDIGLLTGPVEIAKQEFICMPRVERWGVLVQEGSRLAGQAFVTADDLSKTPLLIAKRSLIQHELRNWVGRQFDNLDLIGTYNLIYNAAIMVKNGVGSALCMEHDRTYEGLRFIPLYPKLETGAVLAWKKYQAHSPAAAHFLSIFRNVQNVLLGMKFKY